MNTSELSHHVIHAQELCDRNTQADVERRLSEGDAIPAELVLDYLALKVAQMDAEREVLEARLEVFASADRVLIQMKERVTEIEELLRKLAAMPRGIEAALEQATRLIDLLEK